MTNDVPRVVMLGRFAALVPGLLISLGLFEYIATNQIGPIWFWSSDVCPAANVTCGIMPLGMAVAALTAAVISIPVLYAVDRATMRYSRGRDLGAP